MSRQVDLTAPQHIHVIGIGGAGMSAIARVLSAMGHVVSGSDLKDGSALDRLRAQGMEVFVGHDASQVDGADMVTISSAVQAHNVELVAAHGVGLPVYSRAEMLAAITRRKRTVAVAGTHGKTTTSSMLALILNDALLRPSFVIGADVNEIGTNAAWTDGEWFIVEADESDGTFLELATSIGVVTSVEADHLEHYGSLARLEAAFGEFMGRARDGVVVCADDAVASRLAPRGALSYGFSPDARLRIVDFGGGRASISFALTLDGVPLGEIACPVPGELNARNAAAACAAALLCDVPFDAVRSALARFTGVPRRFEFRGEKAGVSFVDDYAHLPGEIEATLMAARRGGFGRIVCVFQPHRYSRTASLYPSFKDAFNQADLVAITDIYGAGEAPRPGISGRLIADAVAVAHPTQTLCYLPRRSDVVAYLRRELRAGDLCLTLGAGDLTSLAAEFLGENR